ncbi:MAG: carboxypeptidase regulatory-like domain-containing protein, partial [Acidobacteriaceae bacterium]|nr:carboxypeptidase regulatory-like domain-containing protein [Acidobacteriaceae bacterium]
MHTKGKQLEEVQRSRILSMFAVGLLLTLAPVARPVVFSSLRGIVHDPDHRPVADAHIVVKAASSDYVQTLTTKQDGTFES